MVALTLNGVGKNYELDGRIVSALTNIDLTVETGKFVTIVGRSGCGKTTLLRLIARLEGKSSGQINFTLPDAKVGLVFQEPRLMPWLTVEQNMAFSLLGEQDSCTVKQTVEYYLKLLSLDAFKNAYPSQISGGMAQRTALGRALCYNPDLILLDEPLGALDAFTRTNLQNELINIFLLAKKTFLLVTHDVDEAVLLGQRVIVMNEGRITEDFAVELEYPRDTSSREFYDIRTKVLQAIMTI